MKERKGFHSVFDCRTMVKKSDSNGNQYDGDMKDGKKHGQGTLTYADGGSYTGQWANDKKNGKGKNIWSNGNEYDGDWKDNRRHGQGKLTYSDGGYYLGEWNHDKKSGRGVNKWANGDEYNGFWKDNKRHGQGTMTYTNGGQYKGEWVNDKREGEGFNKWSNGDTYEGDWKNNVKHGQGTFQAKDGTKQDGTWENDTCIGPRKSSSSASKLADSLAATSLTCQKAKLAKEFVDQLNWLKSMFDTSNDRCYCSECYSSTSKDVIKAGDGFYVIPRDFTRFGLVVDPVFSKAHDIFSKWIVTFHGTTKVAAQSVITNRQFCLPGDRLIDGSILGIREGHIPDQRFIYTSPTIAYSSTGVYSPFYPFKSSIDNQMHKAQIVLQCRQKPNSYKVQGETIGLGHKRLCKHITNDKMEYFTDIRASIVAYGLLIRVQ